jgi:hypothetical protein
MALFGQVKFNEERFGTHYNKAGRQFYQRTFQGQLVGVHIRKQVKKKVIFRIRWGNGFFGSVLGQVYQDKFKYFVPPSINNPQGQPARDAMKNGNIVWYSLPAEEKAEWNLRAAKLSKPLPGRIFFLKQYIRSNA